MRAIRVVLLALTMLACTTTTSAPRFDIVDRDQQRLLNGDIAYFVTLAWREEGTGAYRSERIRVGQMTYMQLKDRAEACLYANGIRPCN